MVLLLARSIGRFTLLMVTITFVVFIAVTLLPGDAASQQLGLRQDEDRLGRLRTELGLDRHPLTRYADWAWGVLGGDFGNVLQTGLPVTQVMAGPLSRTLLLAALALIAALLIGTALGIAAGVSSGSRLDRGLMTGAMLTISTPEFIIGTLLVLVFAGWLGWLPAVSVLPAGSSLLQHPQLLVLPVCALALVAGAVLARQFRALVANEYARPHIEAARLAGIPEHRVITRHLLPGIAAPAAQLIAGVTPYLLGGAVVVERVFGFPGLGSLLVQAVSTREPFLTMAATTVILVLSLIAFLSADLLAKKGPKR